jgi:diaminopropionate ammonia-lyase
VTRLALDSAGEALGRRLDLADLAAPEVRTLTARMTFGCATDGNHGRSVAQGAALIGARSAVFVHGGVSPARVAAMAALGAAIHRVDGSYDDSVAEAARVCAAEGWTVVSDTAWPGYERTPLLVMQGYTALAREALRALPEPPTHVFLQAGVGGLAAAVAAHMSLALGKARPKVIVAEPARAACVLACAQAGAPVRIAEAEPTVMAMLECYETSLVAWRVLARVADAFMTVEEAQAVAAMRALAFPLGGDPAIVAGESGAAGLAGLLAAAADPAMRGQIGLTADARVLVIVTEGATDPDRYAELIGAAPA